MTRVKSLGLGLRLGGRAMLLPSTLGGLALFVVSAAVAGVVLHQHDALTAADRAASLVARLVVPFLAFFVVGAALRRRGLDSAVWPAAQFGVARGDLALGLVLAAGLVAAAVAACCGLLGLFTAHAGSPGVYDDALTTAGVLALGAGAYVGWFAFGACFLPQGRGRHVVLALDLTLGAGAGVLAWPWPASHLAALVGGSRVAGLAPSASSVLLLGGALALSLLAALRIGR
ncbi:MAG: hypothetical protein R3B72_01740 [Polyangiaceae bacterium]